MQERGEQVSGTLKTILLGIVIVAWATVHITGIVEHVQISSNFDAVFAALVGAVSAVKTKKDDTKD
jgi:uncharacterized membrane protein YeaQ/YmgE (transglycosylase-associated protein family)